MVEIDVIGNFSPVLENKFTKDIAGLKKGDIVVFNITSHGGELDTLRRMTAKVEGLKQRGVKVATFVPDYADSCGFFFFLLGDVRDIAEEATVHYHTPRIDLGDGFIGTKQNMSDIVRDLTAYQEFTNAIFRASSNVDDAMFSVIENSELPMTREHLITLGIIN